MKAILPWGPLQDRLHRELLAEPELLPRDSRLLLAVSGGQDSMALTGLLLDLRRLHGWDLQLWHGDHRWRPEAAAQARDLVHWAEGQGLPIRVETASPTPESEAAARRWRYEGLGRWALRLDCRHVLTGHTGSDRAETLLLNLARGTHLAGLASLRRRRRLEPPRGEPGHGSLHLIRPLLGLTRQDTGRFCAERGLPVWRDPSNEDRRFSRNRLRREVLPVLEALHPGAALRISALAGRLEREQDLRAELLALAVARLRDPDLPCALRRPDLQALSARLQESALRHWLQEATGSGPAAAQLSGLRHRLRAGQGPGSLDLADGWRLSWDRTTLRLVPLGAAASPRDTGPDAAAMPPPPPGQSTP